MGKASGRFCIFVAVCVTLLGGFANSSHALVLDWDAVTWNDGSLINSYDLNSDAINDITITITSQQANIWALDPDDGEPERPP